MHGISLAALELPMGLGAILQRVGPQDTQLHRAPPGREQIPMAGIIRRAPIPGAGYGMAYEVNRPAGALQRRLRNRVVVSPVVELIAHRWN